MSPEEANECFTVLKKMAEEYAKIYRERENLTELLCSAGATISVLRKALEEYAEPTNWECVCLSECHEHGDHCDMSAWIGTDGNGSEIAAAALAPYRERKR